MPLKCFDPIAASHIQAFDISADGWARLEVENRRDRHLRMACCSARVTLRRSRRGKQFFAHKSVGACTTAPETEAHLRLKQMAVEAARAQGWTAETEVSGMTPSGELWKADVLARKGNHQVAMEIQWSAQTYEETERRQARYAASNVRCLWLMRRPGFSVTHELPAALICGDEDSGFTALLKTGTGEQVLPMEELLAAAFSKRLKFGVPLGISARVEIVSGRLDCWSCGAETTIITRILLVVGPQKYRFTVPGLDKHPGLVATICRRLPRDWQIGAIKRRHSRSLGYYLSNGCAHCDVLIGDFFEHDAWSNEERVCEVSTGIDEEWLAAIRESGHRDGWAVYP